MLGRNCLYTFFCSNSLQYVVNYEDNDSLQIASQCLTTVSLTDGYWKVINKEKKLSVHLSVIMFLRKMLLKHFNIPHEMIVSLLGYDTVSLGR